MAPMPDLISHRDARNIASLLTDAKAAFESGRWKQAAKRYAQLADIFSRQPHLGGEETILAMLWFLASAQLKAGQRRRAIESYVRLAGFRERRGDIADVELGWEAAARESLAAGNPRDAERFARRAVEAARRHGDVSQLGRALLVLGLTLLEQTQFSDCEAALKESLRVLPLDGGDADLDRATTVDVLIRLALARGDGAEAAYWMRELRHIAQPLVAGDSEIQEMIDARQADVEAAR
jgi:tetratricopeptide (TPR) repeat protein